MPQVLDSTLPTAHLISQNYRPSAPAEPSGVGPARHVGYLPQVDDMLGLHPDATAHNMLRSDAHESPKAVGTGQGDSQDPFAASSQALQMKSDSMAGSAAQQQEQPKHRSPLRKGKPLHHPTEHIRLKHLGMFWACSLTLPQAGVKGVYRPVQFPFSRLLRSGLPHFFRASKV